MPRPRLSAGARRRAGRCFLGAVAPAPVVALAWWVFAPGGRATAPDRIALLESSGHADALFTVLGTVAAFVVTLIWVARRPERPDPVLPVCAAALVLGSLAGSSLAWGLGVGLDAVLPGGGDVLALRLTALPAVLVWPLVTAAVTAVDTTRDLIAAGLQEWSSGERRLRRSARARARVPHELPGGEAG